MNTGKKIRQIRRSKELTQLQLCELAGSKYTQAMLSNIESGERNITVDELKDFAKALNIEVIDLIND